ncbi:hypothetical protein HNQ07_004819 [Deinococcus metalli]|uniref:Uncharacterized protein n=1 Tax=Deinococcus metalli TaxID=1141878 RepID=A0A7W8KJI1_9DEIO|nr:hypothetical protein [Deinococcus metalli]MBB5379302.1 hypothetical protein [Deinococcus metalli]GHF54621.1 hypothetical protein GCM10017781_33680 [Deinococcus metalli]
MTSASSGGDGTLTLTATLNNDGTLYRVAQALFALTTAPGRRNLRLAHGERWVVYGMTAATTQYAPPTLSLDAGLSHSAHLHTFLLLPLAVETPHFTMRTVSRTTYAVHRAQLPDLFTALQKLAAALDVQDEAVQGAPWFRRSHRRKAAADVEAALLALRHAGTAVMLTRLA